MRIPASTIVMGVVTLIPFGLAFRDVAQGKTRMSEEERALAKYKELAEEEQARWEAERAEEEAAERKVAEARAQLLTVLGAEPATFTGALAAVKLGAPEAEARAALAPLETFARTAELEVTPGFVGGVLAELRLDLTSGDTTETCTGLRAKLTGSWGHSLAGDDSGAFAWRHPTSDVRVVFDGDYGCTLTVERAQAPAQWVDAKAPTSTLPLWAIGGSAEALAATLHDDAERDEDYIAWRAPGLGIGVGPTNVNAILRDGKVIGVRAVMTVRQDTVQALHEHLEAAFGPATETDGGYAYKKKPGLTLTYDSSGLASVLAGKSW